MIKYIFILFFCTSTLYGQNISLLSDNKLKTQHKINTVHHIEKIDNRIFLLCDVQTPNEPRFDILLIEIDEKGIVLSEKIIGKTQRNEFPISIHITEAKEYILVANTVSFESKRKKSLNIYLLDNQLNTTSETPVIIPNLEWGTSSVYNPITKNIVCVSLIESETDKSDIFSIVTQYNLNKKAIVSQTILNKNNRVKKPVEVVFRDQKGNFMKKRTINLDNGHAKFCKNIRLLDQKNNHLLLVGYETSNTVTDFWVAKLEQDKVVWEYQYPTKYGGDEGEMGFLTKEGNYIIFGHEYTKSLDVLFDYRTLLLNSKGEKIKNYHYFYKMASLDRFKDVVQLNEAEDEYLMFGRVQERDSKFNVTASNFWWVAVDGKGNKTDEFFHKIQETDEALHLIKLDKNHVMAFYKRIDGETEITRNLILKIK